MARYQPITYRSVALSNYAPVIQGTAAAIEGVNQSGRQLDSILRRMETRQEDNAFNEFRRQTANMSVAEAEAFRADPRNLMRFGLADQDKLYSASENLVTDARTRANQDFEYGETARKQNDTLITRNLGLNQFGNKSLAEQRNLAFKAEEAGMSAEGLLKYKDIIHSRDRNQSLANIEDDFLQGLYDQGGDLAVTEDTARDSYYARLQENNPSMTIEQMESSFQRAYTRDQKRYELQGQQQKALDKIVDKETIQITDDIKARQSTVERLQRLYSVDAPRTAREKTEAVTNVLSSIDSMSTDKGLAVKKRVLDLMNKQSIGTTDLSRLEPEDYLRAITAGAEKENASNNPWYYFFDRDAEINMDAVEEELVALAATRNAGQVPDGAFNQIQEAIAAHQAHIDYQNGFINETRNRLTDQFKRDNNIRIYGEGSTPSGTEAANIIRNSPGAAGRSPSSTISPISASSAPGGRVITGADELISPPVEDAAQIINNAASRYAPSRQVQNTPEFINTNPSTERQSLLGLHSQPFTSEDRQRSQDLITVTQYERGDSRNVFSNSQVSTQEYQAAKARLDQRASEDRASLAPASTPFTADEIQAAQEGISLPGSRITQDRSNDLSIDQASETYIENYYGKSNVSRLERENIKNNMAVVDQNQMPNQAEITRAATPAAEAMDVPVKQILYTAMVESSGETGIVDHGNSQTIGTFGLQKSTIKSLINQDNDGKIFGAKSKSILDNANTSLDQISKMSSIELTDFFSKNLDVAALFAAAVYGTR